MIARVALPLPIDKEFSYVLPATLAPYARPLTRVKVPFRNRSLVGFIMAVEEGEGHGLKPVHSLVDCLPLIDGVCLDLCTWASRYYAVPMGLVLKYALSSAINIEKYTLVRTEDPSLIHLNNLTLKKACALTGKMRVLDYLGRSLMELTDVFTGRSVQGDTPRVRGGASGAFLYVAGAEERRTRYLSLIGSELALGRNVLMLLPDYHFSGAFFYASFLEHFPGAVSWYGSAVPEKKKAEAYFRARGEGGRLILGNKSCVFLPLRDNGLVIIERPEEDEYRNEEAFKFSAVRLAIKRAEIAAVRVVLGSAAPPVEIVAWAQGGGADIEEGRPNDRPLVSPVGGEQGEDGPDALVRAVGETLDQGGSVVIHTPRRAYAAHLSCAACGQPLLCPVCEAATLSYHKHEHGELLVCGRCRSTFPYEERCPRCGSGLIRFSQVGAEYLEARMKEAFPDRTVFRVTGEAERLKELRSLQGSAGKGVILVGTHVLSKLYGFASTLLILHGWEDFLHIGGYRAREKMFQVLTNLLDALGPRKLLLYTPGGEHFDLSLFLTPRQFYADELEKRRIAEFPPYVRFFLVNVLKRNQRAGERVMEAIERLTQKAGLDHQMLGPLQVKGRYGWRVVLKGDEQSLFPLLSSLYRLPGVHIEADPLFL
jgi:primosomal protein N' (replication factor Y)